MLGRMAGGGVSEQQQREAAFAFGRRHTGTVAAPALPPPPMVPPTKLLLPAGSGVVSASGEEAFSPPPALAGAGGVAMVSPTSTLQAPTSSPTSAATMAAVPYSRRCKSRSRSQQRQRPWEARPVGVGLAGALNGDADADALPPAAATVLTTGQRIRPCQSSMSALVGSPESRCRCRCVLSAREMMEASSEEDYTRVIARGPNPRTTHIFDDRVVVVEDEFLRRCHGCRRDLGQGSDIFMYRGAMGFCSHECRYREMLLLDEQEEESS